MVGRGLGRLGERVDVQWDVHGIGVGGDGAVDLRTSGFVRRCALC